MGFRTVVVLRNDQAYQWENDPQLGAKIRDSSFPGSDNFDYGQVLHCHHADEQDLVLFNHYAGEQITASHWDRSQTDDEVKLKMLKGFAKQMGYRLVKEKQ